MKCDAVRPYRPRSMLQRCCAGLLCRGETTCFLRGLYRGSEGSAQSGNVGVPSNRAPCVHSFPPSRHSLRVRLTLHRHTFRILIRHIGCSCLSLKRHRPACVPASRHSLWVHGPAQQTQNQMIDLDSWAADTAESVNADILPSRHGLWVRLTLHRMTLASTQPVHLCSSQPSTPDWGCWSWPVKATLHTDRAVKVTLASSPSLLCLLAGWRSHARTRPRSQPLLRALPLFRLRMRPSLIGQ